MIVLKERLDALRAVHTTQNAELHLRPDDATVAYVHSSIEAERIGELHRGDRTMQRAHNQLTEDMRKAREQGLRRVEFNKQSHTHALNP